MSETVASLLIEARKIIKASCIHKHPDFLRRSAEALKKLQEAEERIKLLHKNLNSCHEHIARQDRELIALRNKLDGGKTADDILKGLGSTTNE